MAGAQVQVLLRFLPTFFKYGDWGRRGKSLLLILSSSFLA